MVGTDGGRTGEGMEEEEGKKQRPGVRHGRRTRAEEEERRTMKRIEEENRGMEGTEEHGVRGEKVRKGEERLGGGWRGGGEEERM